MEGKFRKRATTVWCPKPVPEITMDGHITKAKSKTGWQNMDFCELCEYCEEFHLENDGIFCLWSNKKVLKIDKEE